MFARKEKPLLVAILKPEPTKNTQFLQEILETDGKEQVRFQVPLIKRSISQKIEEEL